MKRIAVFLLGFSLLAGCFGCKTEEKALSVVEDTLVLGDGVTGEVLSSEGEEDPLGSYMDENGWRGEALVSGNSGSSNEGHLKREYVREGYRECLLGFQDVSDQKDQKRSIQVWLEQDKVYVDMTREKTGSSETAADTVCLHLSFEEPISSITWMLEGEVIGCFGTGAGGGMPY